MAKFSPVERQAYENSLKYYRDLKNVTDTARDEGFEEGIAIGVEKGKEEALRSMLITMQANGMAMAMIAKALSLDEATVINLLKEP